MPAGYASHTGYQYDSISRVAGQRELAPPSKFSNDGGFRNNVFKGILIQRLYYHPLRSANPKRIQAVRSRSQRGFPALFGDSPKPPASPLLSRNFIFLRSSATLAAARLAASHLSCAITAARLSSVFLRVLCGSFCSVTHSSLRRTVHARSPNFPISCRSSSFPRFRLLNPRSSAHIRGKALFKFRRSLAILALLAIAFRHTISSAGWR